MLWLEPNEIIKKLGEKNGERLNAFLAASPSLVFANIRKYGIDCEAEEQGTLHCAPSTRGMRELERRLDQYHALGHEADLLNAQDTADKVGSSVFKGSILQKNAGTIQPLSYVSGLAKAARNSCQNIR